MRAGEEQLEPFVGNVVAVAVGQGHVGQLLGGDGGHGRAGRPTVSVRQPVPRDGQEPALRVRGHPRRRPARQRLREGIGQRILRRDHVPRPRGEKGDEPPVGGPRHAFGGCAGVRHRVTMMGRTSTWPWPAVGHFSAQPSAASRSGASIR